MNKSQQGIKVYSATAEHCVYAEKICQIIEQAAAVKGTGIAKRNPDYIKQKMLEGKAVIALTAENKFAGFCYIESWGSQKNYVANSGLIVAPEYRGLGLGKSIKQSVFELSRKKFPEAKLFGITTSLAVLKINSALGYKPVTFCQLTDDETFWAGCKTCVNFDILQRTNRQHCLCTAMIYDPDWEKQNKQETKQYAAESSVSL